LDPEDARRRRLLNIMLLAAATGALLVLVALLIAARVGLAGEQEEVRALGFGIALALFGVAAIYALNRYVLGELASTLFLLLMIALAAFSDEPRQVVDGRGLLVFTIPILAASVLLRPWASLVTAGLSGLTIIAVGLGVPGYFPNVPAILAFFVLASVSWLSARSLERALEDSRVSSEALRESEEQYRQLVDLAQGGIWVIDKDSCTTFVNPSMAKMLGYSADEMMGKHLFSFMDERGVEIATRNVERRKQGLAEQHDFEFLRKDGNRITVTMVTAPIIDKDGNYAGAIAGVIDITERVRAEEELRESEERFRALVENSSDIVVVLNSDGGIRYRIPSIEYPLGYELGGLVDKSSIELVHPDDLPAVMNALNDAIQNPGVAQHVECRIRHEDGSWRVVEAIGNNLLNNPAVEGIVITARDITERKRAEEELRESEEQFRSLVENAPDIIMTMDRDGTILFINRVVPGLSVDKVIGKNMHDYILPEHIDISMSALEKVFQMGEPETYEVSGTGPHGDIASYSTRIGPITRDGKVVAAIQITTDITERKRAEEELKESENKYRLIFEKAPIGVTHFDKNGVITSCNACLAEILGAPIEKIIGFNMKIGVKNIRAKAAIQQVLSGKIGYFEGEYVSVISGKSMVIKNMYSPLFSEDDSLLGGICITEDITERVRAEEELRIHRDHLEELVAERTAELDERVADVEKLNHAMTNLLRDLQAANRNLEETAGKLEAANEELEAFAYSVSHDLRPPLRHIDGFVQLLLQREGERLDPASSRYLNVIAQSSARMDQLIDDLLAFSRTGRAEMKTRRVELNELVREAQQELAPMLEGRPIAWEISPLPAVEADPSLLRQVWVNLLSNAYKFTAPRSKARIEIGVKKPGFLEKPGFSEVTIFIRDNGVGFDPQYTHKLFGVFQRLHREDEFEGTGIGLAIVRRIIHRHGGRVWAEGELDGGATFYFTLREAKG